MAEKKNIPWQTEDYLSQQRNHWPKLGKHILAQYDEDTVVVYQAFNPEIAAYAVEHQRFGGPFKMERMSWIKTNFLWMMYRCGWCTKKNQERVLAVRLTKQGFNEILANAYTAVKSRKVSTDDITVRLQWDPDHTPNYDKLDRKAIQLGLKGETLRKYATEWVVQIEDVTRFVKEQRVILQKEGEKNLTVARERVYTEVNTNTAARISLDYYSEDDKPVIVKGFTSSMPKPTQNPEVATSSSSETKTYDGKKNIPWQTEDYLSQQRNHWPKLGKHILAQYDEDTVVVYQAFNPEIAAYAVEHQRFGGPFKMKRMSWIKTNFLWMMYRCGWCTKKNQERVLAIRLTKQGFNEILANAYTVVYQKSRKVSTDDITVRLQWDPDHTPNYDKLDRKAIQLGLKGETLRKYATEWIVQIEDVTRFVKEQRVILLKEGEKNLTVARERAYTEVSTNTAARISLDYYSEDDKPVIVKGFTSSMPKPTQNPEEPAGPDGSFELLKVYFKLKIQEKLHQVQMKQKQSRNYGNVESSHDQTRKHLDDENYD